MSSGRPISIIGISVSGEVGAAKFDGGGWWLKVKGRFKPWRLRSIVQVRKTLFTFGAHLVKVEYCIG